MSGMLDKLSGERPLFPVFQTRFFKLETFVFCWAAKEGVSAFSFLSFLFKPDLLSIGVH